MMRPAFLLLTALTTMQICLRPSLAEVVWTIDFEDPNDLRCTLDGANLTSARQDVIAGSTSLIADFRRADGEWHEFLTTPEALEFEPGGVYGVTFEFRILDPGQAKSRFYSLLRSRTGSGKDLYGNFWLWNREQGARDTVRRRFVVPAGVDDYMLILGVRHEGSVLVDDIRVGRLPEPQVPHDVPLVRRPDALAVARDWIDGRRREERLEDLLWSFTRIVLNEGAGQKAVDARHRIVRDLDPDFVDWNAFGPLAREYGIRTSQGGPEYQEYYKFEGEDVWDKRYERFVGNGFSVSLDNTLIRDETWGEGGYFTCHNGKGWHEYYMSHMSEKARELLAVCQDNIACATFTKGYGCFCASCAAGFRRYLGVVYDEAALRRMGVDDLESLDPGAFFFKRNLLGIDALEHPLVREYIKYQIVSQVGAWADIVGRLKDLAAKRWARALPVYGNQIGMSGFWPYAAALSQFCDVIEIEEVLGVRDKPPRTRLTYKVGRAGAWNERPVWIRGPVVDELRPRTPELSPTFWKIHFAEAFACGGIRAFSLGINAPWTGDPDTLDFMDDAAIYTLYKETSEFADQYRPLLARRESQADVAVAFSVPSMILRSYPPLDIHDPVPLEAFNAATDALDRRHVPYDIVVFGHPEFMPDLLPIERYRALVLPAVDAVSDAQLAALHTFVKRGGTLIVLDREPSLNENLDPRPETDRLPVGVPRFANAVDAADRAAIGMPWRIRAPETVTADLWSSMNGATFDLHFVNYDADVNAGFIRPAEGIVVEGTLPEGVAAHDALLILPGESVYLLPVQREGRHVSFELPPLEAYAIVTFADASALERTAAWMREQIRQDRAAVKRLAGEQNLY